MNETLKSLEDKIYFDVKGQLLIEYDRPPKFDQEINTLFNDKADGEALCHVISWGYINRILMQVFNKTNKPADVSNLLNLLLITINSGEIPVRVDKTNALYLSQTYTNRAIEQINSIVMYLVLDRSELLNAIKRYYTSLFNHPMNLRIGVSSWNSAIQERIDPRDWIHFDKNGYSDSSSIGLEIGHPGPPNTFYLRNTADARQAQALVNLISYPIINLPTNVVRKMGTIEGMGNLPFIYSSNNKIEKPADRVANNDKVYWG